MLQKRGHGSEGLVVPHRERHQHLSRSKANGLRLARVANDLHHPGQPPGVHAHWRRCHGIEPIGSADVAKCVARLAVERSVVELVQRECERFLVAREQPQVEQRCALECDAYAHGATRWGAFAIVGFDIEWPDLGRCPAIRCIDVGRLCSDVVSVACA
eukprot:Mycagemm_TRINITY_DN9499_c0_g1::TRINITY_DN9499_c0_g1_i1::g.3078::m.3078 type:complete len:158 gc:universal TRINITY_DN9499_c0_g1_i1:604-131(-)